MGRHRAADVRRPIELATESFGFGPTTRPVGLNLGELPVDQNLGLNLSLPILKNGGINLAYLFLDSNSQVGTSKGNANRVAVMGGDGHFSFGNFLVNAGYSKSDLDYNTKNRATKDNTAWYASVGLESGRWGASVGYRKIDPLFAAPGDWGRIGMWWNPVDIEGVQGSAHLNLSNDIRLVATGEGYRGTEESQSFLTHDDKITRFTGGLEYKMATNYDLSLGVEMVKWDLSDATGSAFGGGAASNNKALERWYNIGFGWSLSDNAKLKFMWQASDYKARELPGFALPWNNPGGSPSTVAKGGLLTTQLSVKF